MQQKSERACLPQVRTEVHKAPSMARDGSGPICPDCGTREALESIGVGKEEQERILDTIHRHHA